MSAEHVEVGRWAVGINRMTQKTAVRFDFNDRRPLVAALPKDAALALARAIIDQYESPPPAKPN